MNNRFEQLLKSLTPEEEAEVETFAAAIVARRDCQDTPWQADDIATEELVRLTADSGGFDWLDAPEEDIYSLTDGKAAQWNAP